jgi:hypothetical protein
MSSCTIPVEQWNWMGLQERVSLTEHTQKAPEQRGPTPRRTSSRRLIGTPADASFMPSGELPPARSEKFPQLVGRDTRNLKPILTHVIQSALSTTPQMTVSRMADAEDTRREIASITVTSTSNLYASDQHRTTTDGAQSAPWGTDYVLVLDSAEHQSSSPRGIERWSVYMSPSAQSHRRTEPQPSAHSSSPFAPIESQPVARTPSRGAGNIPPNLADYFAALLKRDSEPSGSNSSQNRLGGQLRSRSGPLTVMPPGTITRQISSVSHHPRTGTDLQSNQQLSSRKFFNMFDPLSDQPAQEEQVSQFIDLLPMIVNIEREELNNSNLPNAAQQQNVRQESFFTAPPRGASRPLPGSCAQPTATGFMQNTAPRPARSHPRFGSAAQTTATNSMQNSGSSTPFRTLIRRSPFVEDADESRDRRSLPSNSKTICFYLSLRFPFLLIDFGTAVAGCM